MKNIKQICIIGNNSYYARFLKDYNIVENLEDADVIMFTGGEDVDPSLYNCKKHPTTYSNLDRDLYEKEMFKKIRPDQLAVGICRGLN